VETPPDAKEIKAPVSRPAKTAEVKKNVSAVANLPAAAAAPVKEMARVEEVGMESWGDVSWKTENGWYVRNGGAPALYPRPPQGSFTFTVHRRKGSARWVLRWRNSRDFLLFEVDNRGFHRKQAREGTVVELAAVRRKNMEKVLTLRIDVARDAITHSVWANGSWAVLDDWHDAGGEFTSGQFGFWPAAGDEIGLSNFKFVGMAPVSGGALDKR
jgi:hypothetical protein